MRGQFCSTSNLQSDKSAGGDTSGDIDAGGFANADTYQVYVDYYNWMLNRKAEEDAELLAQVQAYAEQGIQASIVEDESSKWAVLATSSVSGRQAFFAYNAERKVVVSDDPGGDPVPDRPPAGDGTIMFRKVAAGSTQGLDGAIYNIYRDGQIIGSEVTSGGGYIKVEGITAGLYTFVEVAAPAGYALDPTPHSVYVDVTDGGKTYTVTAEDEKLPSMSIVKTDAQTGAPIPGTVFSVKSVTDGFSTSVTTGADGTASLDDLDVGVYVVKEESVPEPYIVSNTEQTVALRPGKTSEVAFQNYQKPGLEILKKNIANGEPIPGVTFTIRQIDGSFSTSATTDAQGRIFLENIPVGSYEITETAAPDYVIPGNVPQTVALEAGGVATVTFFNALKPTLTIKKVDSITGDPISGVKFQLWRGSDNTSTGELNDLGVFYTNENGEIVLENADSGWYKVTELEAADGYELPKNPSQEFYLKGGESKTVVFENVPLSALIVWKYDSVTGEAVEGAVFEIKYLSGSSGTGGTVIGTYKTSANGSFTVTGLKKGTYIVTEIASDSGHVVDAAPQTVYISGEEQSVVELYFGNSPKGAVLIKKIDSVTHEPLSDVEFYVTDSSGAVIGDANGKFVTDSAGTILIDGIAPGTTLVVRETRTREGYVLDDVPQTVQIRAGQTVTLEFRNQPKGGLIVLKRDSVTGQPLPGAEFRITTAAGCEVGLNGVIGSSTLTQNGLFTTDSNGEIHITNLAPGAYIITEVKAPDGYVMDAPSTNVVIGAGGDTQTVTITNTPMGGLLIKKMDSVTKEPLADVIFKVTAADGAVVGISNGEFRTDENGCISIPGLEPGSYVVTEVKARDGYLLDDTPKTIEIKDHQTYTLEFFNQPLGNLIIHKLDSVTKKPLAGVQFQITYANGQVVDAEGGKLSSNGLYTTDANGQIKISGIVGTLVVTEIQTLPGYTIDENTRSQTVVINPDDTQSLYFYNTPIGGVEIIKVNEANRTQRIPNVTFEIHCMDGGLVKTVATDSNGRVYVSLEAGSYYAIETQAAQGYQLDSTPHYFTVENGKTTTLTVTNKAFSGVLIHKIDSTTKKGIYGVSFLVFDANHNPIAQIATDQNGYAYLDSLDFSGRLYLREMENEGYIVDTQLKTVYVRPGETSLVEWENTPIMGQIQITKTSADYNSMNGWPAGTPIPGTVFEIYDRAGNLVDTVRTDKNGVAISKTLPLGRYQIIESQAADFYVLDKTPIDVEIEFAGQIVRAAMTNKSLYTNVSIEKTGYAEVMPGQNIRYTFSNIANNSTTALTSFYWRDTLPVEAVRLAQITTGTYNAAGSYKVVYRTNLSGSEYRVLADSLNTRQNYVLAASPTALRLASNEYVTEVMFLFGVVPANFRQVEAPKIDCTVLPGVTNGLQFVNQADVGGVHNSQWIMATTRWVTKVYAPTKPQTLPRTGY